jgi:hypothetical protein
VTSLLLCLATVCACSVCLRPLAHLVPSTPTNGKCISSPHVLFHIIAMLMHPDRQKFEQIRAHWEAALQHEDQSANMGGRKVSQQPTGAEAQQDGTSKFRRTLSNGLAFISNPLSQRKTTPGQQPAHNSGQAVTAAATNVSTRRAGAVNTPSRDPMSVKRINTSVRKTETVTNPENPSAELDATPKALPQSHTTSLLPRPVRSGSSTSVHDKEKTSRFQPLAPVIDPKLRATPSRIPTPSPPLSERRVSSPRQYLPHHTPMQQRYIAAGGAFAGNRAGSLSTLAGRSRTTPNLAKATTSLQPANYRTPKKAEYKTATVSLPPRKPALQENVPTSRLVNQRRSQPQEVTPRRESLTVPATTNRKSTGHSNTLADGKQLDQRTSLTTSKRLSSSFAPQTPTTAQRIQSNGQVGRVQRPGFITSGTPVAQSRLMRPRYSPTPTPLPTEAAGPGVPSSNTVKDTQRRTLGTPNGLGGEWRSSRALAAANHEVGKIPRSSTFHDFRESIPPVPPIPEQYRTASLSSFPVPVTTQRSHHARMVSDDASCESVPEEKEDEIEPEASTESVQSGRSGSASQELSDFSDDVVTLPPPLGEYFFLPQFQTTRPETSVQNNLDQRPWSISDRHYEDNADIEPHLQVRDYMPPLYWAGRFQSRHDQWRTGVMMAQLDPKHQPQGPLGECKMDQEKLAACYILAQLRDLCLTEQAADSLWVRYIFFFLYSPSKLTQS